MKVITINKKISHDFEILEKRDAGIVLQWHEVKSIKSGKIDISWWWIKHSSSNELWLEQVEIQLYKKTNTKTIPHYDIKAPHKLLLKRKEINKIASKIQDWWYALKPIQVYIDHHGLIKITIWLCKHKKLYQKKQALKERDIERNMMRE